MRAITDTEARNNLTAELDRVNDDDDITLITRQKSAAAVLMSLKEYESLMETAHLLRHPKNAMRLMKATEEFENRRHIAWHELHARRQVAPEIRTITLVQPLLNIEARQNQGRNQNPPSAPASTAAVR